MVNTKVLEALESALKNELVKFNRNEKMDWDCPIGTNECVGTNEVGDAISRVLGTKFVKDSFCWQADAIADFGYGYVSVGLTKIYITKGKSINLVIKEILAACHDETASKSKEMMYLTENNYGVGFMPDFGELTDYKELLKLISTDRYCDESFKKLMGEKGIRIQTGLRPELGEADYIDMSDYIRAGKIWLAKKAKINPWYHEVVERPRIEVLYIYEAIRWNEVIVDRIDF